MIKNSVCKWGFPDFGLADAEIQRCVELRNQELKGFGKDLCLFNTSFPLGTQTASFEDNTIQSNFIVNVIVLVKMN